MSRRLFRTFAVLALSALPCFAQKPPQLERELAKRVTTLAEDWWKARPPTRFEEWDRSRRTALEKRAKELGALPEGTLPSAVELIWTAAKKVSSKPEMAKGKLTLSTPYGEAWAYVSTAKKSPALIVGLHGGGEGAGSADEPRSTWVGKGAVGVYPQGIRLVHDTWNTVHGERFVLSLIELAKLHLDVDPDRVIVAGFSMGGSGSWFFAGRHPDWFAAAAPFAGVLMAAPKSQLERKEDVQAIQHGLVPNVRNLAMWYAIGLADKNCMPGTYLYVADMLDQLRASDVGGYSQIHFKTYEGLAHAFPPGEPAAAIEFLLAQRRDTFPEQLTWEYVSDPMPTPESSDASTRMAKTEFYWLGCQEPEDRQRVTARREGNVISITTSGRAAGAKGLTIFLNASMIDASQEVVVKIGDAELYRGRPAPDLWTVFESIDARADRSMVFDRRIEL